MLQGLGSQFGMSPYSQMSAMDLGQSPFSPMGGMQSMGGLGQSLLGSLGGLDGGMFNDRTAPLSGGFGNGLLGGSGLLSQGLRVNQNENRLMQEKAQRNLLKRYLTQATGDPIQSTLISNTIPGRGALDDFEYVRWKYWI